MAIVEMRRHVLYAEQETGGYEDENGNYHAGTTEWVGGWVCDAVPTTKATDVIYEDGEDHHFTFIVYVSPLLVDVIDKGVKVKLLREGHEYVLKVINTRPYKHQLKVYIG